MKKIHKFKVFLGDSRRADMARYLEVYDYYKELIISGQLEPDTKLPSIRKGATQFRISRTTMEAAYMLLAAEGYIISRPQSGYYVTNMAMKHKEQKANLPQRKKEQKIQYDFATSNVDKESFKFDLWRRYMKSALRQDEKLLSYGEPQGETEFREVLANYLRETRNVVCTAEQIVIGAGVQSLLHILCPMLRGRKKVGFYNPNYVQGCAVFEDYGFEIVDKKEAGIGAYYISPSQMTKEGGVMSSGERLQLISEAQQKEFLIIEDDYNSEFKYFQKPTPSVQGLAGGRGVVYLGTFSKMLLPSIRMSYMVLPPELLPVYEERKNSYNQTASKAEQIALTQFIRDGHLAGQIRKSRKIHMAKSEALAESIRNTFGEKVQVKIGETGFHVRMKFLQERDAKELARCARKAGIAVTPLKGGIIMLTSANVAVEDYEKSIFLLKKSFK